MIISKTKGNKNKENEIRKRTYSFHDSRDTEEPQYWIPPVLPPCLAHIPAQETQDERMRVLHFGTTWPGRGPVNNVTGHKYTSVYGLGAAICFTQGTGPPAVDSDIIRNKVGVNSRR